MELISSLESCRAPSPFADLDVGTIDEPVGRVVAMLCEPSNAVGAGRL
jgi:hypothetical protein